MFSNPNGNLLKVSVSDSCSGCGACSALCDCFVDGPKGKSIPANDGCFSKDMLDTIKEAEDLCPEKAISHEYGSLIKETGAVTSIDIKKVINDTLINYQYPFPQYEDFRCYASMPSIDGDGIYGYSSSTYSSESKAIAAGLSELKRVIFNNMDTLAKGLLADYKHTSLTPLITYEKKESNYYYAEQLRISNLIHAICLEIKAFTGKDINSKDVEIKTEPDLGYKCKNLNSIAKIEEELYGRAQEDVESPGWYDSWINTFERSDTITGLFGKQKFVTVYEYTAHDAYREIRKHLESGATSAVREYLREDYTFKKEFAALVAPIEKEVREKGERLLKMF